MSKYTDDPTSAAFEIAARAVELSGQKHRAMILLINFQILCALRGVYVDAELIRRLAVPDDMIPRALEPNEASYVDLLDLVDHLTNDDRKHAVECAVGAAKGLATALDMSPTQIFSVTRGHCVILGDRAKGKVPGKGATDATLH